MRRTGVRWLVSEGVTPKLLLLTHGHFDHVPDVAKISDVSAVSLAAMPRQRDDLRAGFFSPGRVRLEIEPAEPDS